MEQSTIALTVTSGTDLSFLAVVVLICALVVDAAWAYLLSVRGANWMPAQ